MGKSRILVVEARFYADISDALLEGALAKLRPVGAEVIRVSVPGALEVPHAISYAHSVNADGASAGGASADGARTRFDGYIALGCVIRGETTHYDYVCAESARALMDLAVHHQLCIGNGILTVENEDQAWARARMDQKDKGGFAADAMLKMLAIRRELMGGRVHE